MLGFVCLMVNLIYHISRLSFDHMNLELVNCLILNKKSAQLNCCSMVLCSGTRYRAQLGEKLGVRHRAFGVFVVISAR